MKKSKNFIERKPTIKDYQLVLKTYIKENEKLNNQLLELANINIDILTNKKSYKEWQLKYKQFLKDKKENEKATNKKTKGKSKKA